MLHVNLGFLQTLGKTCKKNGCGIKEERA